MDIEKIIEQSEENIRQALQDYSKHTSRTEVLYDVSDKFIHRLAKDNAYAKQELREMFSQSPVWDSKLDALVINGTRTHNPDTFIVETLARDILVMAVGKRLDTGVVFDSAMMWNVIYFFSNPNVRKEVQEEYIKTINLVAPKAYREGRKPSRIFKSICQALSIADETAGSAFQKIYARFADELTAKKIGFKLFISLNPAHFITMSNPKNDRRGDTLTSCHSFNSTEYPYNNGCSGYARDKYTFIVFTVADPTDVETLNNRKTTRQIFAYKPGNGLLLQSRLYNTFGGTRGAQADSKLYRDLVQREISALEGVPNLWKTNRCVDEDSCIFKDCIETGCGFGGYEDWIYRDFDAKVSIRVDHAEDWEPMEVGTYGLCVCCAEETKDGVYCDECKDSTDEDYYCADCGSRVADEDDLYTVYDGNGNEQAVCYACRERHYTRCDRCDEYHSDENVYQIDGESLCGSCRDEYCSECADCGEYHIDENMYVVVNSAGEENKVCEDCCDRFYTFCEQCGRYFSDDEVWLDVYTADGQTITVCPGCGAGRFEECLQCGERYESSLIEDGLCPDCMAEAEENTEKEAVA